MSNTNVQGLPVRNARQFMVGRLLPPALFVAAAMMGADFTATSLGPLKALQIPYVHAMDYAYFIIPAACAGPSQFRHHPLRAAKVSAIAAIVLCFFFISRIPAYASSGKIGSHAFRCAAG